MGTSNASATTNSSAVGEARGELFLTTTTANGSDLRGGVYQLEVH